jgi:hypothetical protein
MFRSISRKMAENAAKRLKTDTGVVAIGTHNGHFHADEALAVYMLRKHIPTYAGARLVRSRDPKLLDECHTVVDVGGEYDPARNRFDHHQRTFATTFPGRQTRLSSAGLIYMHFGREIISRRLGQPEDGEQVGGTGGGGAAEEVLGRRLHPGCHGRPAEPQLERPDPRRRRRRAGGRGQAV